MPINNLQVSWNLVFSFFSSSFVLSNFVLKFLWSFSELHFLNFMFLEGMDEVFSFCQFYGFSPAFWKHNIGLNNPGSRFFNIEYCMDLLHRKQTVEKLYGPFLLVGFKCLEAVEPLSRGSLCFWPLNYLEFLLLLYSVIFFK